MAYQPIYAVVSDNQGYHRSTSSCRGKVNSAGVWVNSLYGTVFRADIRYVDCQMPRISRKGLTREEYRKKKELIAEDVDAHRKVVVNIDLEGNERFEFCINGISIPQMQIQHLQEMEHKRFEVQLDALKSMKDDGKELQVLQLATQLMR